MRCGRGRKKAILVFWRNLRWKKVSLFFIYYAQSDRHIKLCYYRAGKRTVFRKIKVINGIFIRITDDLEINTLDDIFHNTRFGRYVKYSLKYMLYL